MSFGGDSGGNDNSALQATQADEDRKAALRKQIDTLYGVNDDPLYYTPGPNNTSTAVSELPASTVLYGPGPNGTRVPIDKTPQNIASTFGASGTNLSAALDAKSKMATEDKSIEDATRGYYTDDLSRKYDTAARNLRFRLARSGQAGGSEDVDQNSLLQRDRNLGATRVDEQVRKSVNDLDTQREQERLGAISLVNAGAGSDAVTAASRGLQGALSNAQSTERQQVFGDLFSNAADVTQAANNPALALLARYQNGLGTYFPNNSSPTSGRVSAT